MIINDNYIINFFFINDKYNYHQLNKITDDIKLYLENRFNDSSSLKETIYRIKYNIEIRPKCPTCGGYLKFYGNKKHLYADHCCVRCSTLDKNVITKLKKTCIEKYGVESPFLNKDIKDKIKKTSLERYGVEHYTNREKSKQTCLKRYGNTCSFNGKAAKEKSKQTKLERYGDENYTNKEKAKSTCLKKYGVEHYTNREKSKQTCLKRYGVENCGGINSSLEKMKNTWMNNYGVNNPMKSNDVKEKSKQTCLEKYGVEYSIQSKNNKEKSKQTCLRKYGVEHHMKNDLIKSKFNWEERNEKSYKTMKKNNSYAKSKAEDKVYELLKEKFSDTTRQYKSEKYNFNCDFYIPSIDTYIEYQGSHYHHNHPFNENNEEDIKECNKLVSLAENSKRHLEGKKSQYDIILYTWTDLDPRKRNTAKENNLNFIEFWNINEVEEWINKQT